MAAFATTADIVDRWRPLSTAETDRAAILLDAASRLIREKAPTLDARITAETFDADTAEDICCDMVIRVLARGVTAAQRVTVGQVTVDSGSAASTRSGLYLTYSELFRLTPLTRGGLSVTLATPDPD